jgi:hypothetical protein
MIKLPAILAMPFMFFSSCSSESYLWYQETHIKVTSNTEIYESRTINGVSWQYNKQIAKGLHVDPWTVTISGGAPFIELANDIVLVLSLDGEDRFGISRVLLDKYLSLQQRNLVVRSEDIRKFLEQGAISANIDVPSFAFPSIIGFSDSNDPSAAFIVETLNPTLVNLGVTNIEITVARVENGKPDSDGLLDVLPWLESEPFVISAPTLGGEIIRRGSNVLYGG